MTNTLTVDATERSSYTVTLSGWTDAAGQDVTPDTLAWTLSTPAGAVVNSRSAVAATPAASVVIVLNNNDLAFQTGELATSYQWRVLTVEGTYNSSLGSGLALREEYRFKLKPLLMVT